MERCLVKCYGFTNITAKKITVFLRSFKNNSSNFLAILRVYVQCESTFN